MAEVALGASIVSSFFSVKSARDNAKRVDRQTEEQARSEARVTEQKVENLERSKGRLLGEIDFGAAEAGVTTDSKSVAMIAKEAVDEIEREKAFTREVGASNAAIIQSQGSALSSSLRAQALGSAASGISDAVSLYDRIKKRWYGT